MKRKLSTLFITSLILTCSAHAEYGFDSVSDYTGEAFFAPPSLEQPKDSFYRSTEREPKSYGTTPPIKQIRLKLQERALEKEQKIYELAPTAKDVYAGEVGTSDYASKEVEDNFEEMNPDGFESEDLSIEETEKEKKSWFRKKKKEVVQEDTESIILDCENVDYDTENYLVYAKGNVNVEFVKQDIIVKADTITFDRINNTIKAEGNVRILKSGRTITGDYIFVDMNEENALNHKMHSEEIVVTEEVAERLNKAKAEGKRIIAVGTTSVRTLESASDKKGHIVPCKKETDIFIYPGVELKFVDALITNFHLPESTLIRLVSAFIGREKTLQIYREAVEKKYRFFSFGDCCFFF